MPGGAEKDGRMPWELTDDLDDFAATAGDFLRSRPAELTVFLTLIGSLRRRGLLAYGAEAPIFGWSRAPSGSIDGVLLQTPPHPMLFSRLPGGSLPDVSPAAVNVVASDLPLFADRPGTIRMRV